MRTLRLFALLIAASATFAAINPQIEFERRRNAPEVHKVRVVETSLVPLKQISCAEKIGNPKVEGSQLLSRFTGKLKVLETLRSGGGVKRGAVITIGYDVYDKRCPVVGGPNLAVPLNNGEILYAFLGETSKNKSGLTAVAYGFEIVRPKLETKR